MTFKESIDTCLKKKYFFKFDGRASRSEFWWFMLFILAVNLITGLLVFLLPPILAGSISVIVSLLLFPANLGVTVRRFHDRNLSGWWILLPLGSAVLAIFFGTGDNILINSLYLAMSAGYLIILCMPSYPAPNRYGAVPQ